MPLVLAMLMFLAPLSQVFPTKSPLPTMVSFDQPSIMVAPGSSVSITVHGSGFGFLENYMPIIIPNDLPLTSYTASCSGVAVAQSLNSAPQAIPLECEVREEADWYSGGKTLMAVPYGTLLSSPFNVDATVTLNIASNAKPGTAFTIGAPYQAIDQDRAFAATILTIGSGKSGSKQPASQPLSNSTVLANAGEKVSFSVDYEVLVDADSIAITFFSDTGVLEPLPLAYIDTRTDAACKPGYADDPVQPADRTTSISNLSPEITVTLPRWIEGGKQVRVCAEVVAFKDGRELSSWNAMSLIIIKLPK
ncbi:MAG: hypothetical protein ACR2OE_05650 [Thermomicrobiales bacterium]